MTDSGFLQDVLLFHFTDKETGAQSELGISMQPEILKITFSKFCYSSTGFPFTGDISKQEKKISRSFTPPLPKFYFLEAPKDISLIQNATVLYTKPTIF